MFAFEKKSQSSQFEFIDKLTSISFVYQVSKGGSTINVELHPLFTTDKDIAMLSMLEAVFSKCIQVFASAGGLQVGLMKFAAKEDLSV